MNSSNANLDEIERLIPSLAKKGIDLSSVSPEKKDKATVNLRSLDIQPLATGVAHGPG